MSKKVPGRPIGYWDARAPANLAEETLPEVADPLLDAWLSTNYCLAWIEALDGESFDG